MPVLGRSNPLYRFPVGGVLWFRSGETLCGAVSPRLLTGVVTPCPLSCDMGGVVVIVLRGDRLGAGTMTVPVEPVDG